MPTVYHASHRFGWLSNQFCQIELFFSSNVTRLLVMAPRASPVETMPHREKPAFIMVECAAHSSQARNWHLVWRWPTRQPFVFRWLCWKKGAMYTHQLQSCYWTKRKYNHRSKTKLSDIRPGCLWWWFLSDKEDSEATTSCRNIPMFGQHLRSLTAVGKLRGNDWYRKAFWNISK